MNLPEIRPERHAAPGPLFDVGGLALAVEAARPLLTRDELPRPKALTSAARRRTAAALERDGASSENGPPSSLGMLLRFVIASGVLRSVSQRRVPTEERYTVHLDADGLTLWLDRDADLVDLEAELCAELASGTVERAAERREVRELVEALGDDPARRLLIIGYDLEAWRELRELPTRSIWLALLAGFRELVKRGLGGELAGGVHALGNLDPRWTHSDACAALARAGIASDSVLQDGDGTASELALVFFASLVYGNPTLGGGEPIAVVCETLFDVVGLVEADQRTEALDAFLVGVRSAAGEAREAPLHPDAVQALDAIEGCSAWAVAAAAGFTVKRSAMVSTVEGAVIGIPAGCCVAEDVATLEEVLAAELAGAVGVVLDGPAVDVPEYAAVLASMRACRDSERVCPVDLRWLFVEMLVDSDGAS